MAFNPPEVARAIREHRKAAGLTQAELAERAGLAFETISRLESGREPPSLRTAVALADAFATSLDAIVNRSASPAPKADRVPADLRRLLTAARKLNPKLVRNLVAVVGALRTRQRTKTVPKKKRAAGTPRA